MPKNVQTTWTIALISHVSKFRLKILGFNRIETENIQMYKLDFKKRQRNLKSNCQCPLDHKESKEV